MPAGHDISASSGELTVGLKVVDDATTLTTGDGKSSLAIGPNLNGRDLRRVWAAVVGVSSSGAVTVQLRRVRGGSPVDMLSTSLTIDQSEGDSSTAATPAVINAANEDVATGDRVFVDVDGAGTSVEGLDLELGFS